MNLSAENVERWARALCKAWGADADELIGFPKNPRWMSFTSYARLAIEAREIVERTA
jgi:hypothetical protein